MISEPRPRPSVPQAQALRLERLAYGGLSYLVGLVFAAVICWLGYIELRVLLTYLGMIVALNLIYFTLVRTNFNLRLADPNMTLAQICLAIAAGFYIMFYAQQARAPFLLLGVSAAMYGLYQFSTRDFVAMTGAMCLRPFKPSTGAKRCGPWRSTLPMLNWWDCS